MTLSVCVASVFERVVETRVPFCDPFADGISTEIPSAGEEFGVVAIGDSSVHMSPSSGSGIGVAVDGIASLGTAFVVVVPGRVSRVTRRPGRIAVSASYFVGILRVGVMKSGSRIIFTRFRWHT